MGSYSYDVEAPGQKPTYNIEDFQLTMPTGDGSLALRQSTLDQYQPKFARLKDKFLSLVANHDKKYNVSGVPYRGESKRSVDNSEDQEAVPFKDTDVKESRAALEAGGAIHYCPSLQPDVFELVVTHEGHLYIHALADGVASNQKPLCGIHGKYLTGAEVTAAEKTMKNATSSCP